MIFYDSRSAASIRGHPNLCASVPICGYFFRLAVYLPFASATVRVVGAVT